MKNNDYKRVYDEKWNFKEYSMKELVHGIHPYPAMMMPLIARSMFNTYGIGKETIFLDPYVGSGTTLVEAQLYGAKEAIGVDLNPLAILISKTKTENIDINDVKEKIEKFSNYIKDCKEVEIPKFSIRDSWFDQNVIIDLAKIRNYVLNIEKESTKDFFKTVFSEVVRLSSKTRNGEFKLYRMSKTSLEKFKPNAIQMFVDISKRNLGYIEKIEYEKNTDIKIFNENTINLTNHTDLKGKVDLVITSPPYGDSHTTVAYGQFSRLSNEWLDIKEAGTLDNRLLGGKRVEEGTFDIPELDNAIKLIKENDKKYNRERSWEVSAFYHDYFKSIEAVSSMVKDGGFVVYVVGNRTVRNVELPLDVITYKMFEKLGYTHIITHVRDILNKRMPSKASPSNEQGEQVSTMTKEYIVVMKKNNAEYLYNRVAYGF